MSSELGMTFGWLWAKVLLVMWTWVQWKRFFEASIAFSHDAIHAMIGVIIQLIAGAIFRKPISNWWPWLAVLLLILLNEFADVALTPNHVIELKYGASLKDVFLTMFLPTMLLLAVRRQPQLFSGANKE